MLCTTLCPLRGRGECCECTSALEVDHCEYQSVLITASAAHEMHTSLIWLQLSLGFALPALNEAACGGTAIRIREE